VDNIKDAILDWLDENIGMIFIVVGAVLVFVAIGVGIYATTDNYRRQCHNAGGHIISVRDEEICVDHDNRVIFT
jgi:hypothetical protein